MGHMRLVLFDMDHTLVPCDTGTVWNEFLVKRGLIPKEKHQERQRFLFDYQSGLLDLDAAYRFELGVLQLFRRGEREKLLQEFFTEVVKPQITQTAREKVEYHRANGDYLLIITATVDEIARPIAEFFQVDHLIASRGKLDILGNYTGEVEVEPCLGRGKLVHLEAWLTETGVNPEHYTFYSDSHNDMPLLEQVDVPIAVDPDDVLRSIAMANSWEIISFLDKK